jgi:hypothetical protein
MLLIRGRPVVVGLGMLVSTWVTTPVAGADNFTPRGGPPPGGAYTEPAPKPVSDRRAMEFVNTLAHRRNLRLTFGQLRAGTYVRSRKETSHTAAKASAAQKAGPAPAFTRRRSFLARNGGLLNRAGAGSGFHSHIFGSSLGLVLATVLGVLGTLSVLMNLDRTRLSAGKARSR